MASVCFGVSGKPRHATYTVPLLVTAMSANWLPCEPWLILTGCEKVRPPSVERTK